MKANRHLAFLRIFALWGLFSIAGGALAQNVNTNTANLNNVSANRNTETANSNKPISATANNQNASTNNAVNTLTNSTNSIQNTLGQAVNSNGSNSNTPSKSNGTTRTIKFGWFEMSGFSLGFSILVLVVLGVGFVYLTFWHVPKTIENLSGEKIMKYSIVVLILLILTQALLNGYSAQSTEKPNTNTNLSNRNPTNTAAVNSSTANNQNNQPPNTVPNPISNSATPPQSTPGQDTNTNSSATVPPIEEVTDVYKLGYKERKDGRNEAGIGDTIVVEVKNLKSLINRAKCLDKDGTENTARCKKQEIALFLEGRKIDGILREATSLEGDKGSLQYHLQRSVGKNDEAWADLLGNPLTDDQPFLRRENTEVSVGLENEYAITAPNQFTLIRIREYRFWIFTILYLLLLFLLYRLAVKSDILRDIGNQPDGAVNPGSFGIFRAFEFGKKDEKRKPYSLARFQMAFWFLLVIGSFLYIWLITGAYDIITTEVLALIGIGAGTALGAAAIDVGKRETDNSDFTAKEEKRKKLEAEIANLKNQINTPTPPTNLSDLQADIMTKENELAIVTSEIARLSKGLGPESEGFLKDVLTDATGVSFHRFQIFIWTLVLGIIFIISVCNRLSMPEFGATLLGLLGISAGTYLGFKIPEKQTTTE